MMGRLPRWQARAYGQQSAIRIPVSTSGPRTLLSIAFRHLSSTADNISSPPLFRLDKARIPHLHPSVASLSLSVPDSDAQHWAVIAPPTSSGTGAKVLGSLLAILAGRARPQHALDDARIHPSPHPFARSDPSRVGLASFSKQQELNVQGNNFQDYSKRYGALREEDNVTLFERIMYEQGFPVGQMAKMRIVPDALEAYPDVDEAAQRAAQATKMHVERLAPLLGLHKPGPGSPGGVPLLHQPVISLSNGQTRRARICGALVQLARQQQQQQQQQQQSSDDEEAAQQTPQTTLLILDQPFSGLDEASRDELSVLLRTLHAQGSPRVVLVLRRQDDVPGHVTHVMDIGDDGKVWSGARDQWTGGGIAAASGVEGIRAYNAQGVGVGRQDGEEIARLNKIRVQYGSKVVLDDVSMTLRQGARMIVKGDNGSGKTTLLSLLTGMHPQSYSIAPSSYTLFAQPRSAPANATRLLHRRIGYFGPDLLAAFPRRSPETGGMLVGEAIATGFDGVFARTRWTDDRRGRVRGLTALFADCLGFRGDERARAGQLAQEEEEAPASIAIDAILRRPFYALNSGSQALALVLRAIVHQPALLVLDEPFQGMDAVQVARVRQYLATSAHDSDDPYAVGASREEREKDARLRRDSAVVLVSHYVNEWPEGMGEFLRLHDGKVVERIV